MALKKWSNLNFKTGDGSPSYPKPYRYSIWFVRQRTVPCLSGTTKLTGLEKGIWEYEFKNWGNHEKEDIIIDFSTRAYFNRMH